MCVLVLSNLLACILASRLQPFVASASAGTYLTLTGPNLGYTHRQCET